MTNLDLGETVNSHSNLLEKTIYHQNPDVKYLGLNELLRVSNYSSTLVTDTNLIIATIKSLTSPQTRIGAICINLLSKILPNFIEIGNVRSNLVEVLKSTDVVRCRVYEIGVNLSRDVFVQEKVEFILSKLIADLDSDDILLQLNVLELLSQLALTDHGLVYLENKGVISRLTKRIDAGETDAFNQLIIPGLMKFFGTIASKHPQKMFNNYPTIVTTLFDTIISNDMLTMPTALDTLGHLGTSMDGKLSLNNSMEEKLEIILKQLGENIATFTTEMKIRSLNCLEQLIASDTEIPNNQISCLTENWYKKLSSNADHLTFVMSFCKNSFPDIKMAGLQLLKAIVGYKWGQEYLSRTGGFIEYLLDRKVEFDKNVIHSKYEIVKLMSVSRCFDNDITNQLLKYVKEGTFYIQSVIEVAVEGGE